MSLNRFLNYVQYSTDRPFDVAAVRWAGMLAWLVARTRAEDLLAAVENMTHAPADPDAADGAAMPVL